MTQFDMGKIANNLLAAYADAQSHLNAGVLDQHIADLESLKKTLLHIPWDNLEISQGEADLAIDYLLYALRQFDCIADQYSEIELRNMRAESLMQGRIDRGDFDDE